MSSYHPDWFFDLRDTIPGRSKCAPVIAATDGSVRNGRAGTGYIVTDGRWGCGRLQIGEHNPVTGSLTSTICELRAVAALLRSPAALVPQLLLCDSQEAVRLLCEWQDGGTRMPAGYRTGGRGDGARPTLVRLAHHVAGFGATVHFQWTRSHDGHLLNEAADGLASIGSSQYAKPVARQRAGSLAASFLASWDQVQLAQAPEGTLS